MGTADYHHTLPHMLDAIVQRNRYFRFTLPGFVEFVSVFFFRFGRSSETDYPRCAVATARALHVYIGMSGADFCCLMTRGT